MMSSDLVLCHDSVKYEINKCLTTTKSLKKQIKLNLFEKNELELELDFSLLISKFLRIILKQLLSQKDNEKKNRRKLCRSNKTMSCNKILTLAKKR